MSGAVEHLRALRRQLEAGLGPRERRVVDPSLALLELVVAGEADEADAPAVELLDQLEELLEALMHERGWVEPAGGRG